MFTYILIVIQDILRFSKSFFLSGSGGGGGGGDYIELDLYQKYRVILLKQEARISSF